MLYTRQDKMLGEHFLFLKNVVLVVKIACAVFVALAVQWLKLLVILENLKSILVFALLKMDCLMVLLLQSNALSSEDQYRNSAVNFLNEKVF
mmetsp:Transcript_25166/g.29131  ORF Transcript_25166/g.29131 Transcript_25166/m.29131 type:complete len:92 (-) Transcript_25166:171-446(-)